jgi:hypothetical protein
MGVVLFLIVTSLTYGVVAPLNKTTNDTMETITSTMTNTTNTTNITVVVSPITNFYHIITAITTGGVIAMLAVFFLRPPKKRGTR